jgi:hypothetical protein
MPTAHVVSFNIADLPWPFEDEDLQVISDRIERIAAGLAPYDYRLVQEDWFQRMEGLHCGRWYWFPSGLTLGAASALTLESSQCERFPRAGWSSGDWLARKGWLTAISQGVSFANTHLDAGDPDWDVRQEEAQLLREGLPPAGPLLLGGDFNTENATERTWMDAKLGEIGLTRLSVDTTKGKDHLYARDLALVDAGQDETLTALSDHPAIWVRVSW